MMRAFAVLALLLLLLACGSSPRTETGDGSNRRILSLSPHATQMLASFGVLDEVVGVTDYCELPPSAAAIPRVGALMNPNVELMLSLRPTIGFYAPTTRNLEGRLSTAGVEMVALPNESLRDIVASVRLMGEKLGMQERAEELVALSESGLSELAQELDGKARPSVLFVIGHSPGSLRDIHAVGPGTFLEELLLFAGGANRMSNSPTPYPQVSRESLIQDPPDVVLMSPPANGWTSGDREFLRKAWRDLLGEGIRNVRIEFIEDGSVTIPGPLVHVSARQLSLLIHHRLADD